MATTKKRKTKTASESPAEKPTEKQTDKSLENSPEKWAEKSISDQHMVPLLSLRDIVVFPHMVVTFFVGRETSIHAIEVSMKDKIDLLLVCQKDPAVNQPEIEDLYQVGTLAEILQLVKLPDGTLRVTVEGRRRARVVRKTEETRFIEVAVEDVVPAGGAPTELSGLIRALKKSFEDYVKLNKRIPHEILVPIQNLEDPEELIDSVVSHLNLKNQDKQELLEIVETNKRLDRLFALIEAEVEILRVEKRIRGRVKRQLEKSQKEFYLNEQMAAIQKELGERDEFKVEINELEKLIREAGMSTEALEKAEQELRKMKLMAPMSPEATVIRNYLDWLVHLPWKKRSADNLDLTHARQVLDDHHFGLDKIKERIVEFLAVQSLKKSSRAPIICFVGPPGVGKTSLGRSIAVALERQYTRVALGGLRDEAEIRGHRRTYIGALPGKVVQSIRKAGTRNPVMVLDEIDKMASDFRGDPASAMLEVLDPEQNQHFNDHYLEVEFDISEVMFIATANSMNHIPSPLLDRMEVIELSSYMEEEKIQIAERHLIPRQMEEHGISGKSIEMTREAVVEIVRYYTREAGVRNFERDLATICRKLAKQYIDQGENKKAIRFEAKDIEAMLGPRRYMFGTMEKTDQVGMTTGLAWTSVGGDTLAIEVSIMPGRGKLTITGKLGDVMQESAQAAYTYVRSRAQRLGLETDFYRKIDIHIHVPEGATPKDGPSAGIAMATSLTSALTGRAVKKEVAMTGEITLRGFVLPIGGLKEKILAAHRAGIKTVLIPEENKKDLYEVPKEILEKIEVVPVAHFDQVLLRALVLDSDDAFIKEFETPPTGAELPSGLRPGAYH